MRALKNVPFFHTAGSTLRAGGRNGHHFIADLCRACGRHGVADRGDHTPAGASMTAVAVAGIVAGLLLIYLIRELLKADGK